MVKHLLEIIKNWQWYSHVSWMDPYWLLGIEESSNTQKPLTLCLDYWIQDLVHREYLTWIFCLNNRCRSHETNSIYKLFVIRTNELLYLAISKRNTTAETWLASCNDPIHTFWNSQFSEVFQNRNEYLNSEKFRIEIGCLYLISKKIGDIPKDWNPNPSIRFSLLSTPHGYHILTYISCVFPYALVYVTIYISLHIP